jgi:anaerobic magnesium-protoporphyrin IX monomethyl ester cyclase
MRILLLSMPDSFEHTPALAIRMPNGALASLAGNLDASHEVGTADLVLARHAVGSTVDRLVRERQPDLVGLSVMSFQRATALRLIRRIRAQRPSVRVVVGGYDPSLAPDAYVAPDSGVDFIVRGEGDLIFRDLVRAIERHGGYASITGLSWRGASGFVHNPERRASTLARGEIRRPDRAARLLNGYSFMGRQIDVVETSRGCTFDCSFCSIIEMRGRNFYRFPIEQVIADIHDARARGARAIFLVDDNITLDVKRFHLLCRAIIDAGLDDLHYIVQGMTSAVAAAGDDLAAVMRRAGFRYVFLGIENILPDDLAFLRATAKNAGRAGGSTRGNVAIHAIDLLHRHGMYVVGGLIVGNPDDTVESIEANLRFAEQYVDWPYIQHPTPYPRTPMAQTFRERGLLMTDDVSQYDGTTAVVRTAAVPAEEVEFLRWRAERWMKVRHVKSVLRWYPAFTLTHLRQMFGHTFRGCTWRTVAGLEDERAAFARYREIRRREREYLADQLSPRALPPLEDDQVHPAAPVVVASGDREAGGVERRDDGGGLGAVIAGEVEQRAGGEVDDADPPAGSQRRFERRDVRSPAVDVMEHVAHEDCVAARIGEVGAVLARFEHVKVDETAARGQFRDRAPLAVVDLRRVHAAARPDTRGDLGGEVAAAGADLAHDAADADLEGLSETVRLPRPAEGKKVKRKEGPEHCREPQQAARGREQGDHPP